MLALVSASRPAPDEPFNPCGRPSPIRPFARVGTGDPRCYLIGVRRLLTFLMMMTLTIVSGTSIAAAMCQHQNAQEHAVALHGDDKGSAAVAQLEDTAGSVLSKRGALADAGAFSLPAFIIPDTSAEVRFSGTELQPLRPADVAKLASLSIAPLLEPPSA